MNLKDYNKIIGSEIDLKMLSKSIGNPAKRRSPEYKFQVLLHKTDTVIGHINLRFGDDEKITQYIGHVGYGIDKSYRGHRYAMKACELLRVVLKDYQIESLIITCNPDNYPSRNTCELLGAELLDIVDIPQYSVAYSETEKRKCRYQWRQYEKTSETL